MAVATKPVAAKVAAKPVPVAKKISPKAITKPVPAPAPEPVEEDKAAVKAAAAAERAAAAAAKVAEADQARAAKAEEKGKLTAEIVRLREEGVKWSEIVERLGVSINKAMWLVAMHDGATAGLKKLSGAAVVRDRDELKMSWDKIGAQYGLSKPQTQKLYRETSGKDPSATFIGKGGRYFGKEELVAAERAAHLAAREAAPKPPKAPKEPKAPKVTVTGPLFAADAPKDEIVLKIDGKTVTLADGKKVKVKPGSIKVGAAKGGERAVNFTDVATGGARTIKLSMITKVTK